MLSFSAQGGLTDLQGFSFRTATLQNELLLIQAETKMLLLALQDAKTKELPVWIPSSHTMLAPLCKELAGNYVQPALPAGKG